ncbi:hypothetical protein BLOT_002414 [Blomia tropicalis]|nr:hypothetical protein BLOT_002414 [Blomia tropicalis]
MNEKKKKKKRTEPVERELHICCDRIYTVFDGARVDRQFCEYLEKERRTSLQIWIKTARTKQIETKRAKQYIIIDEIRPVYASEGERTGHK